MNSDPGGFWFFALGILLLVSVWVLEPPPKPAPRHPPPPACVDPCAELRS